MFDWSTVYYYVIKPEMDLYARNIDRYCFPKVNSIRTNEQR